MECMIMTPASSTSYTLPFYLCFCNGCLKKILLVMIQRHSGIEGWHGVVIGFAIDLAAMVYGWNV